MLNPRAVIQRVADEDALSTAAAGLFARLARRAAADRGRFVVALSGGSTPKAAFQKLAAAPFRDRVPWSKVHIFWGDERAVAPDHADSNFRMAREALLDKVPIPANQVHRMQAERDDLDQAARDYEAAIASAAGPEGVFDFVMLGMGDDGHTASLFPGTEALRPTERWVVGNFVPKFQTHRMTMTPTILNRAACVAFLAKGGDKAGPLAEILEGPLDSNRLPSQLIKAQPGKQIWFVDRAAAAKLTQAANPSVRIAPSILSADFARLSADCDEAERAGADRLHVDVMDGHFVPNLSIGTVVVKSLRKATPLALETHLMITNPEDYVEPFAEAGSDSIIFHQEAARDSLALCRRIRELGMGVGVTIKPETPASVLDAIIPEVDLALVMTVNPGFGGQKFIVDMLPKIEAIRRKIEATNPTCELEVDGGIDASTLPSAREAGANVFVAGSSVFNAPDGIAAGIARLS